MKFVRFNGSKLGLLSGTEIVDITSKLGLSSRDPMREYVVEGLTADAFTDDDPNYVLDEVSLDAPIRRPGKIVAAAGNYVDHIGEVDEKYVRPDLRTKEKEIRYFLKAPPSIVGPGDTIELPYSDRRCDHEIELAFIVGETVKDVEPSEALGSIFGYTILLDISIRGREDRSSRKSYDTFTPIGPSVVTRNSIDDPQGLDVELRVNGETRQRSNTSLMIHSCADILANASRSATIEAGDLVATGTPSGVGPLSDGDTLEATIESIGRMELTVRGGNQEFGEGSTQ